jgi:Exo-beta-D-glucosaminidase Ig-fold domain/F5/8 type C domain/Glycosyl hydrolases family 2/Glycosyl hydrolases family 2, sugar binding domain
MRILYLVLIALTLQAQDYTLGVGVYPGDPKENFAPAMRIDASTYRNLALHRPAYHSSSYDYNLTAQLVTDGIKETALPRWIATSTSQQGVFKKNEREWLLDGNWVTGIDLNGPNAWVQLEVAGGASPLEIDRIEVDGTVRSPSSEPEIWACTINGSDDGVAWSELGHTEGMSRRSGDIRPSIRFTEPSRHRFYRIAFSDPRARSWHVNDVSLFRGGQPVHIAGPHHFSSAWKSAGAGEEWVYVDLGASCTFDRVTLSWIRRATEGSLQVSDDAVNWRAIAALPASGTTDELRLEPPAQARYVRVLMRKPATPEGYILSEVEVFGTGGPVPLAKSGPSPSATHLELAGGAWRVERDSLVKAGGPALSKPGFHDSTWVVATVPGTVLVSYLNAGAIPDPNFSDNQMMVSDSFFQSDFWYRNEFVVPAAFSGKKVWLHFDGINWKAEVFLNGEKLGGIEGGFMRGRFDVTSKLVAGRKNVLAVRIVKTATPGSIKEATIQSTDVNGGALGADNPTFHASIGWDWIPTIRGRETGIWNRVYLDATGPVTLENPTVSSTLPLPDTSRASVTVEVTLNNHSAVPVSGTLRGRFGDQDFSLPVTLPASQAKPVKHTLELNNPRLWWPVGYGQPNLYDVSLQFETAPNAVSDARKFQAGVRQFTYSEEGRALRMWINGRRFIAKGGSWGFGESMLRYRAREYDAAVRYHAEMNFNMIRNWVGQIGEDEFYEACDRHGVVVWQDFWLANPWDGADPDDSGMFLRNVKDYVLRIRSHPSIGLYVGRNEGYPPKTIDDGIRATLADFHPGIHYISSSADDVVSGHGPYQAQSPKYYFSQRATPQFHSEMGMPNIVTLDSLRLMMPESAMWPQGALWGLHEFTNAGAQNGGAFRARIEKSYGPASNVADWLWLAQFENYQGHRAMFEAQSKNRMGLLIWMSHSCWPSFVWQTYDYFYEPTAAYFGAKKGTEPLHIQWNPASDKVEVVNYSAGAASGLTARVQVVNSDGAVEWEKSAALDSAEDTTVTPFPMEYPAGLTPVHFIRLELRQGQKLISDNFYWRGVEEENYRALRDLSKAAIDVSTTSERRGDRWFLTTTLANTSKTPALMVRLKAVREKTGDRILPAIYSDGYVPLMPGEQRHITTELRDADTRGEKPRIVVEGFNVDCAEK